MSSDHPIPIPFILRGQEVTAQDLLYQSRNGTHQFYYPDPRPLLERIVLSDPTQLQRDFANVRVSEIIDFLAEAGKAMTLNHARMEQACRFSVPFSALPESIVRGSYNLIPVVFSRLALCTMVENEIGSKYLDGWVEMPYADKIARRRAYGARTLHFISGNVPVVAALSIARAALIKSDNILKVTPNDPLTATAIVGAMMDVDPNHPVTKHFSVVYWSKELHDFEHELIQPRYLEKIISWGGALGGILTGDCITIHYDEECGCGWESPWIEDNVQRFTELLGGEDIISCAGVQSAFSDFMEYIAADVPEGE